MIVFSIEKMEKLQELLLFSHRWARSELRKAGKKKSIVHLYTDGISGHISGVIIWF